MADLLPALVWAAGMLALGYGGRWLVRAMVVYEPHCVYKIPLTDGRVYIGHAKDPDARLRWQRTSQIRLPDGHPRKWWPLVPMHVQQSMQMPKEWIDHWYTSKATAQRMETKLIHDMEDQGYALANRIRYKTARGIVDAA